MPNIALLTTIALTPKDIHVEYIICDENVAPINWNISCDLVGITGYTLQFERMQIISAKFRERGIPVAVGVIYTTIDTGKVTNIANHLFIREAEYTWPHFLRDWTAGKAKPVYRQDAFIDMKESAAPDLSYITAKTTIAFRCRRAADAPTTATSAMLCALREESMGVSPLIKLCTR